MIVFTVCLGQTEMSVRFNLIKPVRSSREICQELRKNSRNSFFLAWRRRRISLRYAQKNIRID